MSFGTFGQRAFASRTFKARAFQHVEIVAPPAPTPSTTLYTGPSRMIVNGVDLGTYGLWIDTPDGWPDAPQRTDKTLDVGQAGVILLPEAERYRPRNWRVGFSLIAPTVEDRNDLWDEIKMVLSGPWLEVMILPWADRVCICRYQTMEWTTGLADDEAFHGILTFLAPSAYLVAPEPDSYTVVPGPETELVLGTAPSPFEAQFIGPATRPTLTYYDANGIVRGTFKLAAQLGAGEWFSFESQTYKMERHTELGTVVGGASFFDNDSQLFQLHPLDAVPGRGPSLTLDQGKVILWTRRCFL